MLIESAIEALIGLLDVIDGDADSEPGADDLGEREGDSFMEPAA